MLERELGFYRKKSKQKIMILILEEKKIIWKNVYNQRKNQITNSFEIESKNDNSNS